MQRKAHDFMKILILLCALLAGVTAYADETEEEKITLHLLHYWGENDTDPSCRYMKELMEEDFKEAFPNVDLIQETYDNETYKRKIKVAMAADETMDIMFGFGAGFIENYARAGMLVPVEDYIPEFYKEHMDMELQENFIFDGTQYGIGFTQWMGVLYCNQALFDEVGVEIPQTYEELIDVSKKFCQAGIEPVSCGMMNKWHGQQWINNFTIQLCGAELYKKMARGEVSMNHEAVEQAAQLTADLVEEGVFCSQMLSMNSAEAEEMFLNGEAAMIYIGSWYTETAYERLGEDLTVAKMPVIPGAVDSGDYHGGVINGWVVSADTEYPELAVEIAAWLGYKLGCYQVDNAAFEIEEEDQKRELSRAAEDVLALYEEKAEGALAWDTLLRSENVDTWLNLCARVFDGTADGKGFVKALGKQLW